MFQAGDRLLLTGTQDPTSKISSVKAAQKSFSEDRERSFEAKVPSEPKFYHSQRPEMCTPDDG